VLLFFFFCIFSFYCLSYLLYFRYPFMFCVFTFYCFLSFVFSLFIALFIFCVFTFYCPFVFYFSFYVLRFYFSLFLLYFVLSLFIDLFIFCVFYTFLCFVFSLFIDLFIFCVLTFSVLFIFFVFTFSLFHFFSVLFFLGKICEKKFQTAQKTIAFWRTQSGNTLEGIWQSSIFLSRYNKTKLSIFIKVKQDLTEKMKYLKLVAEIAGNWKF
jgi:hypothetical protein